MYQMYPNQFFNPYQSQPAPTGLVRVNGIDGAKAYQMSPNSTVALFDGNDDLFYVKSTDGAGFPTIRTFRFQEQDINEKQCSYITREEMEEYVKRIIQTRRSSKPEQTDDSSDQS